MPQQAQKANNSAETSGAGRPIHPTTMHLIRPSPWHIATGKRLWPNNLTIARPEERIAFLSSFNATTEGEEARANFATIFHASPAMLCIIGLNDLQYREINNAYEQHTGYSRSEVLGKGSLRLGLWKKAEDRERMICRVRSEGGFRGRQRVFQTKTGAPLIIFLSAEMIEFGGEPCLLVIGEDITLRRQAEEARLDLAQRLINAQEAERTRVARELHDNIGHSLALFTVELDRTRMASTDLSPENDARFARLSVKLKTIGSDVSNLSHQLHSSELELLGIAVAIKALCREFSEQYRVQTDCKCIGAFDNLPREVSLSLFRVLQETLRNVAKHSRATKVAVEMRGTFNFLQLSIYDDGVGFASNASESRAGLGLVSMRERLHLIGGRFTINSKPGCGTRVEATVNLSHPDPANVS